MRLKLYKMLIAAVNFLLCGLFKQRQTCEIIARRQNIARRAILRCRRFKVEMALRCNFDG